MMDRLTQSFDGLVVEPLTLLTGETPGSPFIGARRERL